MNFSDWLSLVFAVVPHVARGILEGSRAAGIEHDTVAKTIAATVLALLQQAPQALPRGVQQPPAVPFPPLTVPPVVVPR